jgi:PAS domain S-box-containing protein
MSSQDPTIAASETTDARLLSIIESAMDAIITVDDSQRVVMYNAAAERIFGIPAADALGSPLERFIPERYRRDHAEHIRAFGSTGVSMRHMGRLGSLTGLRADGTEFPLEASISHSAAGGRHYYTAIVRDITERKRLEEQLLHAQKMEVIGRLAGGIAHDFNNLLMAIFNYLTLATRALEPEHPSRAALAQVHEASNRAATLTRQLLTFARKQVVKPRVISLRDVVAGLEPMLRRLITNDIALKTELGATPGTVRADPTQLEQVIMNLVVNARDAMPSGGTLTIATGETVLDEAYCHATVGAAPGPHVTLTVTDTGIGMSKDIMARIFEPFFTTKDPGKGTGLGLATCHGIVTQGRGHITVRSSPGAGTTIQVLLPRAVGQAKSAPLNPQPSPAERGTETVLFAEDSNIVRELISGDLMRAGYTVLAAGGGAEALGLAKGHTGHIHLLITDLIMPGMSGVDLYSALSAQRGTIPVLYISGGGEEALAQREGTVSGSSMLAKPFTTDTLLRKIRSILDNKKD